MSIAIDGLSTTRPATPRPMARGIGLVLLIVAEMFAVTYLFEPKYLVGDDHWWARLLVSLHWVPHLLMAVAASVALFWGPRLRAELASAASSDAGHRTWAFLAGQLATFGVLLWLTSRVLGGDLRALPHATGWVAAWVAAALATFGLWVATALPIRLWRPVAARAFGVLAAGLVVGVAACYAGTFTEGLWQTMGASTLRVVHVLLQVVCGETVCRPQAFVVGTPSFTVSIVAKCSGFEGIGLIWVFLGVYLVLSRRRLRFPQALVLLPIGTVVMWLANAVRIAALVLVGTWGAPAVAAGGFHSQAGWLAFNAVGLALVAVSGRWRWIAAPTAAADDNAEAAPANNRTTAYLAPLMAIVAVSMVTGAFTSGFDLFYPIRVVAAAAVLAACWRGRVSRGMVVSWSWEAVLIGVAVFGLWLALEPAAAGAASETELARGLAGLSRAGALAWIVFRVVGSVVTVPIAEELAFRGYLTRRLIAPDFEAVTPGAFSWLSFLVSSAVFGAMHGRWLAGTLAGMLYALALYRRGRLADAVLAHATTNALIAADVLLTGNWFLWS